MFSRQFRLRASTTFQRWRRHRGQSAVEPHRGAFAADCPHDRPNPDDGPDDGAVTAETAMVLPAIVLVLAVVLAGGAAAATQVRCEEAAGAAARVVARGETPDAAVEEARSIAGDRARVAVEIRNGRAEAEVVMPAPGILGDWGALDLSASASTITEGVVLDELP
ncbi:TadE family type IV pilus minor pilin [Kocuria sp.]|uniref:TadE family type IV pilus minor pilin n=1 Tax=Kocuria sp. TaxID=1871328 RepID=UPI0026DF2BE7|nr:TadE family type IV pilus minor pilin [Kocuria sp.]MDO5618562.1 TadE family type IV pilus minor pilin [Kocuria sp.]